jgi:hypothetical protein
MGAPYNPSERDIVEAIELAKEVIDAVGADEESWFDRLMDAAARGSSGTDQTLHETYRQAMFVMMREIVKSRPIVLTARAEPRVNENVSVSLRNAVDAYENGDA